MLDLVDLKKKTVAELRTMAEELKVPRI